MPASNHVHAYPQRTDAKSILVLLIVQIGLALPFVLVEHHALFDLPNHTSRLYIMFQTAFGPGNQYYEYLWSIQPNMAIDMFVFLVGGVVGIETGVRLFACAIVVLLFTGVAHLSFTINGRLTLLPVLCAPLIYSGPLLYGFVNFSFGVGIALHAVALWTRTSAWPVFGRLLFFSVACLLLYVSHLFALGIFGICVAASELHAKLSDLQRLRWRPGADWWKSVFRDTAVAGGQLIGPLVARAMAPADLGATGNFAFGGLYEKVEAVAAITLFSHPLPELAYLAGLGGMFLGLFVSRVISMGRREALIVSALVLSFAALPRSAIGATLIDYRMPSAVVLFFVAYVRIGPAYDWTTPMMRISSAVVAAFVAVRIVWIMALWGSYQPALHELSEAVNALPVGAKVYTIEGSTGSTARNRSPPLHHWPTLAAGRRRALVSNLFADIAGSPIRVRDEFKDLARHEDVQGNATRSVIPNGFDHVFVLRPELVNLPEDFKGRLVSEGRTYRLFVLWFSYTPTHRQSAHCSCQSAVMRFCCADDPPWLP